MTSQLCKWNHSRKSAEPTLLKNINFKRPKKNELPQEPLDKNAEANYTIKDFTLVMLAFLLKRLNN